MRKIPVLNYFLLGLVVIIVMSLCYLFYDKYTENKLDEAIMNRYIQVINYNEITNYVTENSNAYIYVSVLKNKEIRDFEIRFKNIINRYELNNKILYLDLTTIMNNNVLLSDAINNYHIDDKKISNIPNIMVFNNGELTNIIEIDIENNNMNKLVDNLQEIDLIGDDLSD